MRDLEQEWRDRLRELSVRDYWAMWRWCYQDGSCWALIGFPEYRTVYAPSDACGWACWTEEDGSLPVVGVFVEPARRGRGIGQELARGILHHGRERLPPGSSVYAASKIWSSWKPLIEEAGFEHAEWE